jgi:hypothetical protein
VDGAGQSGIPLTFIFAAVQHGLTEVFFVGMGGVTWQVPHMNFAHVFPLVI